MMEKEFLEACSAVVPVQPNSYQQLYLLQTLFSQKYLLQQPSDLVTELEKSLGKNLFHMGTISKRLDEICFLLNNHCMLHLLFLSSGKELLQVAFVGWSVWGEKCGKFTATLKLGYILSASYFPDLIVQLRLFNYTQVIKEMKKVLFSASERKNQYQSLLNFNVIQ